MHFFPSKKLSILCLLCEEKCFSFLSFSFILWFRYYLHKFKQKKLLIKMLWLNFFAWIQGIQGIQAKKFVSVIFNITSSFWFRSGNFFPLKTHSYCCNCCLNYKEFFFLHFLVRKAKKQKSVKQAHLFRLSAKLLEKLQQKILEQILQNWNKLIGKRISNVFLSWSKHI